jgi:hypothetical protein
VPEGAGKKGTRLAGSSLFLLRHEDNAGRAALAQGWLQLGVCSSRAYVEERDNNLDAGLNMPVLKGVMGGP